MVKKIFSSMKTRNPFKSDSGFRQLQAAEEEPRHQVAWTIGMGAVGSLVGGGLAYQHSQNQIEHLPLNSVAQTWKEPVMTDKVLGQIPADFSRLGGIWSFFPQDVAQRDVHAREFGGVPKLDTDGHAILQTQSHTFVGHGNPVVGYESRPVQAPYLDSKSPYSMSTWPISGNCHEDSDGNQHCDTIGYWYRFHPNVQYTTVETPEGKTNYEVPKVHFETGVNTVLNTFLGTLAGFGLFAVATYFIQRALQQHQG